jgi:cytoskeletal protein RodZ
MLTKLRRFWIQLTSNRKQFGVLCAAVAVGLLLWARLIVVSNMPRTAMADKHADAAQSSAAGAGDAASGGATAQRAPRPSETVYLDVQPLRDPFVVSDLHFPRLNTSNTLTSEDAKSVLQRTEDPEQVEAALTARLAAMVDELSLDAVATLTPLAVISGRTFRVGDLVPAMNNEEITFRLTEVKRRSVILEWEGRTFELTMKSPGV